MHEDAGTVGVQLLRIVDATACSASKHNSKPSPDMQTRVSHRVHTLWKYMSRRTVFKRLGGTDLAIRGAHTTEGDRRVPFCNICGPATSNCFKWEVPIGKRG